MNEQGRSDLPSDINGRNLDRLAGLEKIILPEQIGKAIADTGKRNNQDPCRAAVGKALLADRFQAIQCKRRGSSLLFCNTNW